MSCRQQSCKQCDSCKKCLEISDKKHRRRKKQCSKYLRKQQVLDSNLSPSELTKAISDNNNVMQDMVQAMISSVKQAMIEDLNTTKREILEELKNNKEDKRIIDDFNPWSLADYDEVKGLNKKLNVVHKKYLYNSVIMADRKIIKLLANRKNIDILSLNIINYLRYSNMLNIESSNNFDSSLILESSLNGIQKIFQEYAEIIAVTGDNISYTYLPITNSDKLKMLLDIIITGRYTNGFLDTTKIIDQFTILLDNAQPHIKKEEDMIKLRAILDNIKLSLKDNPNLTSWHQLITSYQKMNFAIYPILKQVYQNDIKDNGNNLLHEANILIHEFYQLGRQIGIFFALFYAITYFLHYFLDAIIPGDNNNLLVMNDIFDIHIEWWKDHALLICDYNKAAALEDKIAIKEVECEISTSYTHISYVMEETFVLFHRLVKVKNLYIILDSLRL